MRARTFQPSTTCADRARQAWVILVGKAMNRQSINYGDLGRLMFEKKSAGVLGQILGHIAFWCEERNLPQLNAIVVGAKCGRPGERIPLSLAEVDQERERVYKMKWQLLCPPTIEELDGAWMKRP
ncbi:MAG: hypothetical protein ABSF35_20315 [Polyangia bacterium]